MAQQELSHIVAQQELSQSLASVSGREPPALAAAASAPAAAVVDLALLRVPGPRPLT